MRTFSLFLFLALPFVGVANVFVYTGVYQGTDLYVKNPFALDGVGFCVFEVRVNGEVTSDEWNSSAFAVDFALFGLKLGDPVEVVIRTKDSCEPKIINLEAISPESTFEVTSLVTAAPSSIRFTTTDEQYPLVFAIEQFKWNKWVEVAQVEGKGLSETPNQYEVAVPMHSGVNSFRVVQPTTRNAKRSPRFDVESRIEPVAIRSERIGNVLEFSAPTDYEVYNAYGALVARGHGQQVNATAWKPGIFYINYDQRFGHTIRKR